MVKEGVENSLDSTDDTIYLAETIETIVTIAIMAKLLIKEM